MISDLISRVRTEINQLLRRTGQTLVRDSEMDALSRDQRNGPVGTVNLVFLHAQTKFENRAEDTGEIEE